MHVPVQTASKIAANEVFDVPVAALRERVISQR